MDMNKHQLIAGLVHDLGDENNGVQVRGYRNLTIIKNTVEALTALQKGLQRDDEAMAALLAEKNATIEKLKAKIAALEGCAEEDAEDGPREEAPHED